MNPSNPSLPPTIPAYEPPPSRGDGPSASEIKGATEAADLIRLKLTTLYAKEPDSKQEALEVLGLDKPKSKHQVFMYQLSTSGKTQEEIHAAWHNYYFALSNTEKYEVWREFNENQTSNKHVVVQTQPVVPIKQEHAVSKPYFGEIALPKKPRKARPGTRSVADIKQQILSNVTSRQKLKAKHHFQSLFFGLGVGSLVMLFLLFGFFNERFVAPFITPSKQVSATPIIVDNDATTVSDPAAKVIIPKINVEIPVVYDEPSIEEKPLQNALERGVVHYATTPSPGEQGNVVVFGHSSNNIFNNGQYKFAFVLLSRLEEGDVFYLTKDGKRYTYRVYSSKIVKPTDVGVLGAADKPSTATLITCDPPGTSLNRLVVTGEQISPDPDTNTASTAAPVTDTPLFVPSNAPTLWDRLTGWL